MTLLTKIAVLCALSDATVAAFLRDASDSKCDRLSPRMGLHYVRNAQYPELSTVESGSPMSVKFVGKTRTDVSDGDIEIKVRIVTPSFSGLEQVAYEFELDLCSQLAGISCPMPAGTEYEGVATWNAPRTTLERVLDAGELELAATAIVRNGNAVVTVYTEVNEQESLSCNNVLFSVIPEEKSADELGALSSLQTAIDPMLVQSLNARPDMSWTAEESPRFDNYSVMDARRIAGGTIMRGQQEFEDLPRRRYSPPTYGADRRLSGAGLAFDEGDDIPDSFDTREAFPECADIVGRIRDQSDCGSCWAFASTEAFNDRRCIAAIGKKGDAQADMLVELSAEDTTACCSWFHCGMSMGCNGGQPGSAWKWFARTGVVTGGDFSDIGKGTTCKPYEFQPCAHHVDPGASGYPECPGSEYPTPECLSSCSESDFSSTYKEDKRMAKEAYSLIGIEDVQRDMMKYGSVTAAFSVYSDFLTYSGGVYQYTEGAFMGGHAVKIIGWGTDEDTGLDYWLVANSWNDSWGENGLFRLLRGSNECGIEGQIVTGEA